MANFSHAGLLSALHHRHVNSRRVQVWLKATFNIDTRSTDSTFSVAFTSLRDGRDLWLRLTHENGGISVVEIRARRRRGYGTRFSVVFLIPRDNADPH